MRALWALWGLSLLGACGSDQPADRQGQSTSGAGDLTLPPGVHLPPGVRVPGGLPLNFTLPPNVQLPPGFKLPAGFNPCQTGQVPDLANNSFACVDEQRACPASSLPAGATAGVQTFDTASNAYGPCVATACASGYALSNGTCTGSYTWKPYAVGVCGAQVSTGTSPSITCDQSAVGSYVFAFGASGTPTNPAPVNNVPGTTGAVAGHITGYTDASGSYQLQPDGTWALTSHAGSCAGLDPNYQMGTVYVCAGP